MAYDYDLFVIGAGSGGVRAARLAAIGGARVGVAEADRIGGTCVIRGCVPKKFMVYASEFGHAFDDARGFGWNIAKHFFVEGAQLLGLRSRSEDFIWLDADSKLGREYWNLHNMAANFAVANRLIIGEAVCAALEEVFGGTADIYYEISHNLIQKEGGKFVARKGATRAFPKGHPSLKKTVWEHTGHPILIPGSMETGSAILFAREGAKESLHSINHGAGRALSRTKAKQLLDQKHTDLRMAKLGVLLNTRHTPLDESGPCYKDLNQVLSAVEEAGLARVEKRLKPIACIKGND